jgi:Zn finger protein HypA/HybF involved in hydrogenase expression
MQGKAKISEIITYAILVFAGFALAILVFITIKAFRSPTLFYASEESIEELAAELSCPKCRSRKLTQRGSYTLGCENCGFTFSVGTVRKRESE